MSAERSSGGTAAGDLAARRREAARELVRLRWDGRVRHLIAGARVDSAEGGTFETRSPVDGSVLATVAAGDADDVDRAARAAAEAFRSWRRVGAVERRALLHRVADLIEAHADELTLLEVLDTGQPWRYMSQAARRGARNFRFFADRAEQAGNGLSLPDEEHLNYTLRQPLGPVGVITPWNTPFMLSTWKIAPALAAGCTVVHKPAEWSPLTGARLAELMSEAGLPDGVVNTVQGYGETAGRALTEHPLVRAIAFVGESATGSRIMAQGAATLKRLHLELGGKNPVVVFADADLERALDAVVFMIYSLNGERCTSSSRVLIEQAVYRPFVERIAERARAIRLGDPFDPATDMGPLIHPDHHARVTGYLELARREGARLAAGGGPVEGLAPGFVAPTLFTDARPDMRIAQEEVFGPVLTAIPFADEAEALELANGVGYGLAAYLWTRDAARAHRFARDVEAGMVWVNSQNVRHLPTPFGGAKMSGVGRDGGDYSFDFYMETKNVAIALGEHDIPRLGA